ncbi:MAG: hypothetical protein Kow0077_06000 [Anaerolineae bacterium]
MTDYQTSEAASPDPQQQARGLFGLIKALGTASERVFRKSYRKQVQESHSPSQPPGPDRAALVAEINARQTQIEHLTTILQSIEEGVIMQDLDGRVIIINDAAYKLLGSQKSFWESGLARLHEDLANQQFGPGLEPVGQPIRLEINNRILGAQIGAVSDDNRLRIGTLIVLRDITRDALAERLKDEFITQISHELRTPLTAIKGMSEVLLSQPEDRPPNRKFLEAISRNVDVLDHMIIELLDISEISAGTFAVRQDPIALDDLMWSVIRGHQPRLERAQLEVHMMPINAATIAIPGDLRRLRWALDHILENSINYTLPGGRITVRVGQHRGDYVLIEIEDTGVGIREVDLPHVFNRFFRGEARTPDNKRIDPRGLGQGLFIARAVAEAHGGYVGIQSEAGKGTIVTFALPRSGVQPAKPSAETATPTARTLPPVTSQS